MIVPYWKTWLYLSVLLFLVTLSHRTPISIPTHQSPHELSVIPQKLTNQDPSSLICNVPSTFTTPKWESYNKCAKCHPAKIEHVLVFQLWQIDVPFYNCLSLLLDVLEFIYWVHRCILLLMEYCINSIIPNCIDLLIHKKTKSYFVRIQNTTEKFEQKDCKWTAIIFVLAFLIVIIIVALKPRCWLCNENCCFLYIAVWHSSDDFHHLTSVGNITIQNIIKTERNQYIVIYNWKKYLNWSRKTVALIIILLNSTIIIWI